MPVVRRQREISQAPIPGVRKTAAETALSRGAGVEQAKMGLGAAIADFGETVARVGIAKFAQLKQAEREKADQVAALAISNYWSKFDEDYFRDPATGALKREGKNALGIPEEFEEAFTKAKGIADAMATTDEQKMEAERIAGRAYQNGYATARRHTFGQMQAYGKGELNAKVKNSGNAAIVNAHDPARVAMEISEGEFAIRHTAPQYGAGAEEIEEMVGAFKSNTMAGVITTLITDGNDLEARVYFEEHDQEITEGAVRNQIGEKVKRATTKAKGARAAGEIWKGLAPDAADDISPISIDKMEAAAREKWGDDQDALDATIDALRSRMAGVQAGRNQRLDAQSDAVWGSIRKGARLEDLERSPAFVNSSGKEQQRVAEYFRREREHTAALRASEESRAASADSRAYTAAQRKEQQLEDATWEAFHGYNDPAVLRSFSEADLLRALPELGIAHVNRLIAKQAAIKQSDAAYRAAVIDADTFKDVGYAAGMTWLFNPRSDWSPTQLALSGRLQEEVESEIGKAQVKAGGYLSREDKKAIAHTVLDAQALKPGYVPAWMGGGTTVRIVDVPADHRARITRSLQMAGQPVTPQAIIDAYMRSQPK